MFSGRCQILFVAEKVNGAFIVISFESAKQASVPGPLRSREFRLFYRVVDSCVGELLHRAYCLARDGKARRRKI